MSDSPRQDRSGDIIVLGLMLMVIAVGSFAMLGAIAWHIGRLTEAVNSLGVGQ